MIGGDNRMNLRQLLDWAQKLQLVVVSADYRLAPETPHRGPVEDCYAGLSWTAQHADQVGIDPNRIVLVGESAGGGLAASLALLTRDRGGPSAAGQLLMAPMLDDRNEAPSVVQMAGVDTWDRERNEVGCTALLGTARGAPEVSSYAAPARAVDLAELHVWPGGFHGYDVIAPDAGISRDARAARLRWLGRLLARAR
jgi:acetyl esterase/lipase